MSKIYEDNSLTIGKVGDIQAASNISINEDEYASLLASDITITVT